jgi:hypothetical protein
MGLYVAGPRDTSSADATTPRAGDCSVTPEPDPEGSYYGETQLFTLRAVAVSMPPITKRLAITLRSDGSYVIDVDGSGAVWDVVWKTQDDFVHADPDAFIPLPYPLEGGWDVDIQPNIYSPGGYVANVRNNC